MSTKAHSLPLKETSFLVTDQVTMYILTTIILKMRLNTLAILVTVEHTYTAHSRQATVSATFSRRCNGSASLVGCVSVCLSVTLVYCG